MSRHLGSLHGADVPSATKLPDSPRRDYDNRVRNYLLSMSLRTACFIGAFVFTGWLRWVCVAFAVVLPYIAVVFANAAQQRRIDVLGSVEPSAQQSQVRSRADREHPR